MGQPRIFFGEHLPPVRNSGSAVPGFLQKARWLNPLAAAS
jgi:hypothetical protein